MIEVPAAALLADKVLEHVDFLSIGTNDLAQYAMAADRMSAELAALTDPWQPAVLALVAATARAGAAAGKPVGVCGEAAADPLLACVLAGLGITSLSAAAAAVPGVGAKLASVTLQQCRDAADAVLEQPPRRRRVRLPGRSSAPSSLRLHVYPGAVERQRSRRTRGPQHGLAGVHFSHPSRDMPLPGNVNAVDRFQRAAYYSALMPKPETERQAVASVMAVMRNVSVPFGAPYGEFGVYNTEYRTVTDLTNLRYFFELTTSPNVIWVDFGTLDLPDGTDPQAIDPYDETLIGNVTSRFAPRPLPF